MYETQEFRIEFEPLIRLCDFHLGLVTQTFDNFISLYLHVQQIFSIIDIYFFAYERSTTLLLIEQHASGQQFGLISFFNSKLLVFPVISRAR